MGDYSCSRSREPDIIAYCLDQTEATRERCSDGIDNDNNGYTDCADYSCKRANDLEVRQACQEGVGETSAEANAHCSDMQDNDGDGFTDCADWDCSHNPLVTIC